MTRSTGTSELDDFERHADDAIARADFEYAERMLLEGTKEQGSNEKRLFHCAFKLIALPYYQLVSKPEETTPVIDPRVAYTHAIGLIESLLERYKSIVDLSLKHELVGQMSELALFAIAHRIPEPQHVLLPTPQNVDRSEQVDFYWHQPEIAASDEPVPVQLKTHLERKTKRAILSSGIIPIGLNELASNGVCYRPSSPKSLPRRMVRELRVESDDTDSSLIEFARNRLFSLLQSRRDEI